MFLCKAEPGKLNLCKTHLRLLKVSLLWMVKGKIAAAASFTTFAGVKRVLRGLWISDHFSFYYSYLHHLYLCGKKISNTRNTTHSDTCISHLSVLWPPYGNRPRTLLNSHVTWSNLHICNLRWKWLLSKVCPGPFLASHNVCTHHMQGESLHSHSIGLNYLLSWSTMSSAEETKAGEVGPSGNAPFVHESWL